MPSKIYTMSGSAGMQPEDYSSLDARLMRVENIVPYQLRGNTYARQDRNSFLPIASGGLTVGKLNLTATSGISFVGAMAPSIADGQLTVACPSDSTATIYYDGTNSSRVIVIRRSDQTTTTIPGSTLSLSGLTASATYTAYSYWAPNNACGLGWVQGDTGTPQIAFSSSATASTILQAKAAQHYAGREEIASIQWTQPTGGSSSGAADPSNPPNPSPGQCVMINTLIEPVHPIDPWDWKTTNHPETEWIRIITDNLMMLACTHNHPLYDADEQQHRADWFKAGQWIMTNLGIRKIQDVHKFYKDCTKQEVEMKHGHLFWANGFLSHNFKPA